LARRALDGGDAAAAVRAAEALTGDAAAAEWRTIGWYLLARAHEMARRPKEALAAFERAAAAPERTRERADALYGWAALLAAQGDLAGARRRFDELAEQTAGTDAWLDLRARALHGLADLAEREEKWDEAARLHLGVGILFDDPQLTPESLRRAAECFRRLGADERAEQILRELAERYPNAP
jgi:TolA-binding protein